mgnify:CR=1 FL=1
MNWAVLLSVALAVLVVLLFSGAPVFTGFLVLNTGTVFALFGERGFGMITNSIYATMTSHGLITIPLFVLVGELLFRSGSINRLHSAVDVLVGQVRGRTYYLVVGLSTVFGALSGSAIAVSAVLGRSVLPGMIGEGYEKKLSATTILAGASLSPIIPPSLIVVIVGSLVSNVSIAKLLIAGIGPGLVIAAMVVIYCAVRVARNPDLAPPPLPPDPISTKKRTRILLAGSPFLIIIVAMTGFILLGITTPSESAATGVLAALMVAAIYRELKRDVIVTALKSSARISASILIIVASSQLFGQLLSLTGATRGLVTAVTELNLDASVMVIVLMLVPLVLCMFVDQLAFLVLAIPLYEPVLKSYDYDPIWFWTLFIINLTIGSISPPFGYTLFGLQGAAPNTLGIRDVYAGAWPVFGIFVVAMILMFFVPGIITSLPGFIK